ncbi:hypothetical protein SM11_pC0544 (plasmid) [Sinorhizobium meliloti SM11]|uniref:Uncharacterized protein n=1 Tax=Sinorhizobium meliloti (strain SM11) TaxID=707241 RepID=F7XDJ2_SINMM|nr:hypothetical protein SM11_pC0544 [Sinorhizobium meliloti SM11]
MVLGAQAGKVGPTGVFRKAGITHFQSAIETPST